MPVRTKQASGVKSERNVWKNCQTQICLGLLRVCLLDDIGVMQHDDVTDEVPNDTEYERGIDEETMRPFKRIRGKKMVPECPPASGAGSSSREGMGRGMLGESRGPWEEVPGDFQDE